MNPLSLFDLANIAVAGFSAISAVLLLLAYAVLIGVPGKSIYSVASCAALVTGLSAIQIGHLPLHSVDQHGHRLPLAVRLLRGVQGSDGAVARRLPAEPLRNS